jgi:hypothetical protein
MQMSTECSSVGSQATEIRDQMPGRRRDSMTAADQPDLYSTDPNDRKNATASDEQQSIAIWRC